MNKKKKENCIDFIGLKELGVPGSQPFPLINDLIVKNERL